MKGIHSWRPLDRSYLSLLGAGCRQDHFMACEFWIGSACVMLNSRDLEKPCRLSFIPRNGKAGLMLSSEPVSQNLLIRIDILREKRKQYSQVYRGWPHHIQIPPIGRIETRHIVRSFKKEQDSRKQVRGWHSKNFEADKIVVSGSEKRPYLGVKSKKGNWKILEKSDTNDGFEERLELAVRSAKEKKKLEEDRRYGAIDYDDPVSIQFSNADINLPVKIGLAIAVAVFGIAFVVGDIFQPGDLDTEKSKIVNQGKVSIQEDVRLEGQLKSFEEILKGNPEDLSAIKGKAVTYAELGDYSKAASGFNLFLQKKPEDVETLVLLAEVQNKLGHLKESASTYRKALQVSSEESFAILKGLVEVLIAAGNPDEAIQEILIVKDQVSTSSHRTQADGLRGKNKVEKPEQFDPVEVDLLLGKTYLQCSHVNDAIAVYNSLIAKNPEDFRSYLAKAILLHNQGQRGEAERMFIQARYLAPEKLKAFVDRYTKS